MAFEAGLGCGVEHVVVLMFENRSFDNLLGTLYPAGFVSDGCQFEGLPLDSSNLDFDGVAHTVWTENPPTAGGTVGTTPDPDPGERFQNVNYQLYGRGFDPSTPYDSLGVPSMSGFVKDYTLPSKTEWIRSDPLGVPWPHLPRKHDGATASADGIMHYFSSTQLPIMSALAKQYAVCDQWFASVATQTFANRMFALAASSDGGVDDFEILRKHAFIGYPLNNVFQILDDSLSGDPNWRVYYDDTADSYSISEMLIRYVHDRRDSNLSDFAKNFATDVAAGLPPYTFIEPNYGHKLLTPSSDMPNSYHPPFDVLEGEQLLWIVYNALQTSSAWGKTLLIVTFDEHGGCYDHFAPPPVATPLAGTAPTPPFDRYGVRVPTILISPMIAPGSIFRAPAEGPPLDHCSLIRTVLQCFVGPDAYINQRDRYAPDVSAVLDAAVNNPGITTKPMIPPSSLSRTQREAILSAPNHLSQMWKAEPTGNGILNSRVRLTIDSDDLRDGGRWSSRLDDREPTHDPPGAARPSARETASTPPLVVPVVDVGVRVF